MFNIKVSDSGGINIFIKDGNYECNVKINKDSLKILKGNLECVLNPSLYAKRMLATNDDISTYFHINNGGVTFDINENEGGYVFIIRQSHMGVLNIVYSIKIEKKELENIIEECNTCLNIDIKDPRWDYARVVL